MVVVAWPDSWSKSRRLSWCPPSWRGPGSGRISGVPLVPTQRWQQSCGWLCVPEWRSTCPGRCERAECPSRGRHSTGSCNRNDLLLIKQPQELGVQQLSSSLSNSSAYVPVVRLAVLGLQCCSFEPDPVEEGDEFLSLYIPSGEKTLSALGQLGLFDIHNLIIMYAHHNNFLWIVQGL